MGVASLLWGIAGVITIIGTILASYLSYGIYKYNRLSSGWLAMVLGYLLLVFSRLITFSEDFNILRGVNPIVLKVWDMFLIFTVSVLFIIGLRSMKKAFESFDVIEKKTQQKVTALSAIKKKGGSNVKK